MLVLLNSKNYQRRNWWTFNPNSERTERKQHGPTTPKFSNILFKIGALLFVMQQRNSGREVTDINQPNRHSREAERAKFLSITSVRDEWTKNTKNLKLSAAWIAGTTSNLIPCSVNTTCFWWMFLVHERGGKNLFASQRASMKTKLTWTFWCKFSFCFGWVLAGGDHKFLCGNRRLEILIISVHNYRMGKLTTDTRDYWLLVQFLPRRRDSNSLWRAARTQNLTLDYFRFSRTCTHSHSQDCERKTPRTWVWNSSKGSSIPQVEFHRNIWSQRKVTS